MTVSINKFLDSTFSADVDEFSGKAVDVWSLGVTLYCMTFNKLPFWDESEYNLFQKINKEEYFFIFLLISLLVG